MKYITETTKENEVLPLSIMKFNFIIRGMVQKYKNYTKGRSKANLKTWSKFYFKSLLSLWNI